MSKWTVTKIFLISFSTYKYTWKYSEDSKAATQRCRRWTELPNNKWTSILYKSSGKVLKVWNKHTVSLLPLNIIYISPNQFFNISALRIQLKYIIITRSCLDLYKEIEPLTEPTIFRCDISQNTGSLASTNHIQVKRCQENIYIRTWASSFDNNKFTRKSILQWF